VCVCVCLGKGAHMQEYRVDAYVCVYVCVSVCVLLMV